MPLELQSPAFRDGDPIPAKYARDGENLSPPLRWNGAPEEAKSFLLVVEDPDAPQGVFHHWAVHGIRPDQTELQEGVGEGVALRQNPNDFGRAAYDGPQPPRGHGTHHYHFKLAALDVDELDVPKGADAASVWAVARPHVLEQAEIVGTYERS